MSLEPGSIVLIGFSADNRDESFTFVTTAAMLPGTQISFHCRAWKGSGFDKSGSSLVLSFADGLPAGTVVNVAELGTGWPQIVADASGLSAQMAGAWDLRAGGAIYVTAGDALAQPGAAGGFLYALALANGSAKSVLDGTGLVAGETAVILPIGARFDQMGDVGSVGPHALGPHPDPDAARRAFSDHSNWIRDGEPDDGMASGTSPESRALSDPNSPLYGRFSLTICFMAGTLIRTPDGDVPVESLAIGNAVVTSDGRVAPVKWIGRQTVATRFADALLSLPVRVRAGALADNVPSRDLFVSPDHALLVEGVLVNAGALVDGLAVTRVDVLPTSFTYYHVELHDHALILAENTPAETFVDNVERMAFDNWAEHEALYPDAVSIPEMAYPRAKSARQVPQAIRRRLAVRASLILGSVAAQAA